MYISLYMHIHIYIYIYIHLSLSLYIYIYIYRIHTYIEVHKTDEERAMALFEEAARRAAILHRGM